MKITNAGVSDRERIREIYLNAFDEAEGETVAGIAVALLSEESDPRPIHLLAEVDRGLVGHVAFSPVFREGLSERIGYILAPLAVAPGWQKRGIGSALVEEGLRRLKFQEGGMVFVYGDPAYYQRFGFSRELAERFLPPCPLSQPGGWQALQLDAQELPGSPVSVECVRALSSPRIW